MYDEIGLDKVPCVYTLVLCMYKGNWNGATKDIFTKNRQFWISQVISYLTLKHLAKNLLTSVTMKNASNSIN